MALACTTLEPVGELWAPPRRVLQGLQPDEDFQITPSCLLSQNKLDHGYARVSQGCTYPELPIALQEFASSGPTHLLPCQLKV